VLSSPLGHRRPPPCRRPGRAKPAVHRLGGNPISPAGPFRDRRSPLERWLLAAGPIGSQARGAPRGATPRVHQGGDGSLRGNRYEVDPALVGRMLRLVL